MLLFLHQVDPKAYVMGVMRVIDILTGTLKPSGEHRVKTKRQQAVTVKNKIVFLLQSS